MYRIHIFIAMCLWKLVYRINKRYKKYMFVFISLFCVDFMLWISIKLSVRGNSFLVFRI